MDHKSYLTNNQNYFEFKTTIHFVQFAYYFWKKNKIKNIMDIKY